MFHRHPTKLMKYIRNKSKCSCIILIIAQCWKESININLSYENNGKGNNTLGNGTQGERVTEGMRNTGKRQICLRDKQKESRKNVSQRGHDITIKPFLDMSILSSQ